MSETRNDPYFLEKHRKAEEFLRRVGLPKDFTEILKKREARERRKSTQDSSTRKRKKKK